MLYWHYEEAYKLQMKIQRDYDNHLAWLSGFYVRNAVGSIFDNKEYPEPLDFVEMDRWNSLTEEEKNRELQQQAVENSKTQMERIKAMLEMQEK